MGIMKKLAFIFPGQGSQITGMGKDLYSNFKIAKKMFDQADDFFNFSLTKISFQGPDDLLKRTTFTQPALYVNSCIISSILKKIDILPDAVAGHSIGELSALFSAGSITFEEGLKIVKIRSEVMDNAGLKKPGTMAAIIGASKEEINLICKQKEIVVAANYNSKEQTVISGTVNGIKNAIKTGKKIGLKRIFPLKVSGAFHSPLMNDAQSSLKKTVDKIRFKNAKIPVFQNYNSYPVLNSEELKKNFVKQLTNSVLWYQSIDNIIKNNINIFLEIGPNNILQRLNRRINKNTVNFGISNVTEINNIKNEI